jgi:phosphonate transport system substrate-binding protein
VSRSPAQKKGDSMTSDELTGKATPAAGGVDDLIPSVRQSTQRSSHSRHSAAGDRINGAVRHLSRRLWLALTGPLFILLCSGHLSAARAETVLSFGVVPQFPMERIATDWNPVLQEISRASGLRLELKYYATIPEFEKAFLKGELDIAYLNPYHAVMARKSAGYIPIIRDEQRLTGILVVRKDSPVTRLDQLDGATIAFPAPNAFGASLYMRALLTEQARIRFTPVYRTTHSNVHRHVLSGQAQAGGAVRQTLDKEAPEVRESLRILYETPAAYSHPIVVHPRVPMKGRQALQQAFLNLAGRTELAPLLKEIQMPNPVIASYENYAPLEKLGLERFVVLKAE